jgi:hypothetical protein
VVDSFPTPEASLRIPTPSHNPAITGGPPRKRPISERSGTADAVLSEKSPFPRSSPENAQPKRFQGTSRAGPRLFPQ